MDANRPLAERSEEHRTRLRAVAQGWLQGESGHRKRAMVDESLELTVADAVAWRRWLNEHHATSAGVRRIEQFVAMLARGETVYPQKRRLADRRSGSIRVHRHRIDRGEARTSSWVDGPGSPRLCNLP
jgi:FAD binding domain